ncbi:hypothetical protein GQ457_06G020770 [Hibiscus cannabinus]
MEENFAKLEADLREQLERDQQELRDTMVKSQQEMLDRIAQMMGLRANEEPKEKETCENPGTGTKGLPHPPIFVINTSMPPQGASNQEGRATSH